jgi:hypothetical protein
MGSPTALCVLWDRYDGTVAKRVCKCAADSPHALDALWALNASGGFDARIAEGCFHRQADARLDGGLSENFKPAGAAWVNHTRDFSGVAGAYKL